MKKIASIFLATVIAVMSFNFCITAVTQTAGNVDLTQSLIYNIKPNSWTINEGDYQNRIVGGQFSFFTDGAKNSTNLSDGDYGKFLNSDGSFKNTDGSLTVYHDFVFPLDEKTGTAVEVEQFFLSVASDGSLYTWQQFEVYFALELNHLTDDESRAISYTNTEKKADILIDLETPVTANYMLVRCINGVHEGADANNSYPRISEIACFGNDAVNQGFTVSNALPDGKSLSDSVIYNSGYAVIDNKHGTGTNVDYNSWNIPAFQGLTDGNSLANTGINQPPFYTSEYKDYEKDVPNLGNKLERTGDYVFQLTDKDGVSQKVDGVYVACAPDTGNHLTVWRYQIYISDSLENLTSTESLAVSFCNKDLTKEQYFAFDEPISGAYIMLRVTSGIPLRGHGLTNWATKDWDRYTHLSEFAVFGTDTDEYTLSNTSPENLTDSVIYGTETEHSLVQVTLKDNQISAIPAYAITGTFAKLTDGTLDNSFGWGFTDADSSVRFHSTYKTIHNATGYLETYEDYIFDLNQKYNGPVDISSVFVNGSVYKLEIYASNSRNDIDNPENLVATVASDDSNKYIELNTPVTAGYLLVRSIFCRNYTLQQQGWVRTALGEVAVFGAKSTGYSIVNGEMPEQALYESYLSGRNPIDFYVYDNGVKYSLMSGAKNELTNCNTLPNTAVNWQSGTNPDYTDINNGSFLYGNGQRRNVKADMNVYTDVVYMLDPNGASKTVNTVYVGEGASDGNCTAAYSYEIFIADSVDELGSEASFAASILNPEAKMNNYVELEAPVTGKYIMLRITMGVQEDTWPFGGDLSYARLNEFAAFGEARALLGDVNNDDTVDIRDLVRFKRYLSGEGDLYFDERAADVDENGALESSVDLLTLKKHLLLLTTYRPSVYEENGEITQEMANISVTNRGNRVRLANKLESFKNGGDFTIGYLGGSCTAGSGASAEQFRYVNRVTEYLREAYPNSTFTMVNAGIGATGSLIGVHRMPNDILSHNVDLLFVEYSVNDSETDESAMAAYESILYRAWNHESQPAIITLSFINQLHQSAQHGHYAIAEHYDIPMISFGDVVRELVANRALDTTVENSDGTTTTVSTWEKLFADSVHPSDLGHKVISQLIASYLSDTAKWTSVILADGRTESDFSEIFHSIRYSDGEIVTVSNTSNNPLSKFDAYYEANGFNSISDYSFAKGLWEGAEGSTLTFTVTAKNLGIIYNVRTDTDDITYGHIEIEVDGEALNVKPNCNSGAAKNSGLDYCSSVALCDFDEVSTHTVTVKAVGGYGSVRALAVSDK